MQERLGEIGEFWLSKRRGSEQWCRTWYDTNTQQTRRSSLGTSDLQEAKLKLWEWYARHGKVEKQAATESPLELVLVRYWEQHAKYLASSEMEQIALRYWSDFFSGAAVSEVTPQRQREFVAWLQDRRDAGYADGYIKRILTVGKAALNRAWRENEVATVPYVIAWQDSERKKDVLTESQTMALWHACKSEHERMYLALAFCTLGRPEAVLGLRRDMIDFNHGLIDTNPPGRVQTKKYRPVVPIAGFLEPWLAEAPDGPLVQWRGKPVKSFKTAWRRMRKDAGLPKRYVPKIIRHTMATHLRRSGVPKADVEGMLGHSGYGSTSDIYAHYEPGYLQAAITAIDAYMARVNAVLEKEKARS